MRQIQHSVSFMVEFITFNLVKTKRIIIRTVHLQVLCKDVQSIVYISPIARLLGAII